MLKHGAFVLLVLAAVVCLDVPDRALNAQPAPTAKFYRIAGERDGVSHLPKVDYPETRPIKEGELDFRHYAKYDEVNAILKKWAQAYPNLTDLYVVGKSFEGRDIWQMTITNKATGKDTDKPAMFYEGGRHSGEVTGTAATLWMVNHLFQNYGKDPEITKLIDTKTLYFRPINNPDGSELYRNTVQRNRSTVRPWDEDLDGLLDEDSMEDLDGDGFVRQMRVKVGPGKGDSALDPKDPSGRLMVEVGEGKGDYKVYQEGIDNDGDGHFNEDGIGGIDLHRNYPENWHPGSGEDATGRGFMQGGAGEYPTSETETRAVVLFTLKHPNISVAQTLDTVVPMILHGPSTHKPEEGMNPADLAIFKQLDAEGQKMTGYPYAGDAYWAMAYRSMKPGDKEPSAPEQRFGHSLEWGYYQFGAIWYGDELWTEGRMKDYNNDGFFEPFETLRWNDENRGGADYKKWTPYTHPQLGDVEIGGWNPKFYAQNPPVDLLEEWASKEAMFNLFLFKQLPQVRITSATATPVGGMPGTFDITMTCTNEGNLPTALEQAKLVKAVRPDTLTIDLPAGMQLVQGDKVVTVGSFKSKEVKKQVWRVKSTGAGEVTLAVVSTRGGVEKKTVAVGSPTMH